MINLCCPSCKVHLTLPADKENNEKLLLVCPENVILGENPTSYIKLQSPQFSNQDKPDIQIVDPTIIIGNKLTVSAFYRQF